MPLTPQVIPGRTFHARHGAIANRFSYGVDYILLDAEAPVPAPRHGGPRLFSRNRANLTSLHDVDHGGRRGEGRGATWVREVAEAEGLSEITAGPVHLLAQPRVLGHVFNPVCFWLLHDGQEQLRAVIAEVNNTFGDRHSYLCLREDRGVITGQDVLRARKIFHVSPFQRIAGDYAFRFDIRAESVAISIDFRDPGAAEGTPGDTGAGGVLATLAGPRLPLTDRAILAAMWRRPFGSRRVLALIFWQAARLRARGARYLRRPAPPEYEVSR